MSNIETKSVKLDYDQIMQITEDHKIECKCEICKIKNSKQFSFDDMIEQMIDHEENEKTKTITGLVILKNTNFNIALQNVGLRISENPRLNSNQDFQFKDYEHLKMIEQSKLYDLDKDFKQRLNDYEELIFKGNYEVCFITKFNRKEWLKKKSKINLKTLNMIKKRNTNFKTLKLIKNKILDEYRTKDIRFNFDLKPHETALFIVRRKMDNIDLNWLKKVNEQKLKINSMLSCNLSFMGDVSDFKQ